MLGRVKVTIDGKESNYRLREAMPGVQAKMGTHTREVHFPFGRKKWIGAPRGWGLELNQLGQMWPLE